MSVDTERYMGELPMPSPAIASETCVKCGGAEPMIRYHAERKDCGYYATARASAEHLHLTCRTCMYEWTVYTADTP